MCLLYVFFFVFVRGSLHVLLFIDRFCEPITHTLVIASFQILVPWPVHPVCVICFCVRLKHNATQLDISYVMIYIYLYIYIY